MKKTNGAAPQKIYVLDGASGGTAFTVASIAPVIISFIWSVCFALAGKNPSDYAEVAWYAFASYGMSALALFCACAFIIRKSRLNVRAGAALFRFEPKYLWISALISFGLLFGLSWLNEAFVSLLSKFGYKGTEIFIPKNGAADFIMCLIVICALPAILEETLFRGIILNGSRYLGAAFSVFIGGFLFSIYHKNPMQTPYQFATGALFVLVALKSGSVFPSMIMHFINNLYIIIFYFATPNGYEFSSAVNAVLRVAGLAALAFAVWFLLAKCKKSAAESEFEKNYAKVFDLRAERKQFILFALFGIFVCAALWIINLVSAF